MNWRIVPMDVQHLDEVVALQTQCFPPPFDPELLWRKVHLERHLALFPEGQFVSVLGDDVIASCSNTLISEENWLAHRSWEETVGGYFLETFDADGTTLYGLDISVHPSHRRQGIAKALYQVRFDLVRVRLSRYGTACRLPDFIHNHFPTPELYASAVVAGRVEDRTLSPLLKLGLTMTDVLTDYMDDPESGNAAALLEWTP